MSTINGTNVAKINNQIPLRITDLPFEILSIIFSFLPNSSLKILRLVCRLFYDIATKLLFSSIFVSARHLDREIAEFVAARFPDSIQTLTFSTESYYSMSYGHFVLQFKRQAFQCKNPTLHREKAENFWKLYCKIGSERQTLYESGAVNAQLCHLLKTLPKIRQIVVTDKRRRQDLSWFQEALMGVTVQLLPPPQPPLPLASGLRRSLADLHKIRKEKLSDKSYKTMWTLFQSGLRGYDVEAVAQVQKIQSVGCDCFDEVDEEPPSCGRFSGLGDAGTPWMPQNPWAVIMTALHKSSNASTHTISIQPKDFKSQLPIAALKDCDPVNLLSNKIVLARLTKLELRLTNSTIGLNGETRQGGKPTKMLSAACNLQSLTISISNDHLAREPRQLATNTTTFELLLAGCRLPQLSTLRLHNVTFLKNEFTFFLQDSQNLRDLSLNRSYMVDSWYHGKPTYADRQTWGRLYQTMKDTLRRLEHFSSIHWHDFGLLNWHDFDSCKGRHCDSRQGCDRLWTTMTIFSFDAMAQRFFFNDGINPVADVEAFGVSKYDDLHRSDCGWCKIGDCIRHQQPRLPQPSLPNR